MKEAQVVRFDELKSWLHKEWKTGEDLVHEYLVHVVEECRDHFRNRPESNYAVVSMRHPTLSRVETVTIIIRREEAFCCPEDKAHKLCKIISS